MKIAVTGVSGLLGSALYKTLSDERIEVHKLSRDYIEREKVESISDNLFEENVSVLVHCAANTDVEACELDRLTCYKDNIILSEKLAKVCAQRKIKFVFISSTGIYGDHQEVPYCEYDDVIPTTVHHSSKYKAEQRIAEILDDLLVVRTGWLFGGDWDMPKNFVANRIKEAINSDGTISSDISQRGNPTYVYDVSRTIHNLIRLNQIGIFNCVNTGVASRFEYVEEIVLLSGLDVKVMPVDGSVFERKAKVSHNESAINFKLSELGFEEMPFWKDSLRNYINSIRLEYGSN